MKRIRTALCLILAAALLAGCAFLPSDSEPETPAPTDPLTGLALEWQGQRPVAVAIENSTASTTQWGLSSASVVLEALTEVGTSTELCLVYPALPRPRRSGRWPPVRTSTGGCWWASSPFRCSGAGDSSTRTSSITIPSGPWMLWKPGAPPSTAAVSGATHRCGTPAARPSLMSWTS